MSGSFKGVIDDTQDKYPDGRKVMCSCGSYNKYYNPKTSTMTYDALYKTDDGERLYVNIAFADMDSDSIAWTLSMRHMSEFPEIIGRNLQNTKDILKAFKTELEDIGGFNAIVTSLPIPLSKAMYFPPNLKLNNEKEYAEYARRTLLARTNAALDVVNSIG